MQIMRSNSVNGDQPKIMVADGKLVGTDAVDQPAPSNGC
jgi:hypothetical protein